MSEHAIRDGALADAVPDALARLRARGERVTPARRAVLEVLASAQGHLSAEDVVARAESLQPGLHRATIYRTLESLCASGLAVHVHLGHGATTYHLLTENGTPHLHVSCGRCGRVLDAPTDLLEGVHDRLMSELGFRLEPAHTALLGTCASCLADGEQASEDDHVHQHGHGHDSHSHAQKTP